MAVKVQDHPHGTFVVGERATVFDHEHTALAITDHPVKYYVTFDGECHRPEQVHTYRFSVPQ